ncbi:MAG: RelA/SpoT family protein, partial [Prevotella sp.]|nr:RelA/SpoT family protein [Prevotella sp.]
IKELMAKNTVFAKEMFERRLKNRKIEWDESAVSHLIKKLGYKEARDFYRDIADGSKDLNDIIDTYQEVLAHDNNSLQSQTIRSAKDYNFENHTADTANSSNDVLVIDKNLKGVDYSLAKCCSPIYGDDVFGFVTVNGGIKIHRTDCPNAPELRKRFGYRIVKAKWSGKGSSQYSITLRIIGNDDIGIVNNITSIIAKEEHIMMRSINIDSNDGLFSGNLTVNVEDTSRLEQLIKKLRTVKGVKQVTRL